MDQDDHSETIAARVREAAAAHTPLMLAGGGSKHFLGRRVAGTPLAVGGHCGILHYVPEELVLSARAGTPLAEIETALAERGQMLAFEPPYFGATATLGGTIAANLSGPRRAYAGAARDFVLGCRLVNGKGEILHFGGEVMKNVAGYDLSRLMAGAFGTLGVLLEVSLKVLPRPETETTLVCERDETSAIELMNRWAGRPLPLSATAWSEGRLYVRLSGPAPAIAAAAAGLGGECLPQAEKFWSDLREHTSAFFTDPRPLWRLGLPATVPPLALDGPEIVTWGGAQRWVKTGIPADQVRAHAAAVGGHATLFRPARDAPPAEDPFTPLTPALHHLHQRLKAAFDPAGILNPGRLYAGL